MGPEHDFASLGKAILSLIRLAPRIGMRLCHIVRSGTTMLIALLNALSLVGCDGDPAKPQSQVASIIFPNPGTALASVTPGGVIRSSNLGASWARATLHRSSESEVTQAIGRIRLAHGPSNCFALAFPRGSVFSPPNLFVSGECGGEFYEQNLAGVIDRPVALIQRERENPFVLDENGQVFDIIVTLENAVQVAPLGTPVPDDAALFGVECGAMLVVLGEQISGVPGGTFTRTIWASTDGATTWRNELEIEAIVADIACSGNGDIWLATVRGAIYLRSSESGSWSELGGMIVPSTVLGIASENERLVVAGLIEAGVSARSSIAEIFVDGRQAALPELPGQGVHVVRFDDSRSLWAGSDGLYRLDARFQLWDKIWPIDENR